MQPPVYSPEEALTRETFLALMWALSYPGRIHTLPDAVVPPMHAIGMTLLDLETSFYTPDTLLADVLARSGARALEPDRAAYHFYPELTRDVLPTVKFASTGTMLYPDQSATLIIGCTLGNRPIRQISGPGIQGTAELAVDGLSAEFWAMRERANRYPLGWDIFLLDGNQVIGLPRTTQISQEGQT